MTKIIHHKCRIHIFTSNEFDPKWRQFNWRYTNTDKGLVVYDGNQESTYIACQNHPRVVQRTSCSLYYGANSDIQRLLLVNLGEHLIQQLGKEKHPQFLCYLGLLRCKFYEQFYSLDTVICYLTSYTCQGGDNTAYCYECTGAMVKTILIKSTKKRVLGH